MAKESASKTAGGWWAFFLAILFFAGLPIGLIRLGGLFVATQEKARLGRLHLQRIERNLFRLKREGGDLFYIQREMNSLYGLIKEDEFSSESILRAQSGLLKSRLSFVRAFFFDSGGEYISLPGQKIEYKNAMKRIYAGLIEPEMNGKSDLLVKNRSLFQAMFGNIDSSDMVYQKGNLTSVQIKGRSGYFYWNTFYKAPSSEDNTGKSRREYSDAGDAYAGGMIAFFEEQVIPRDLALKELIGRFNRDTDADEGYALVGIESPAQSYGIKTVSRRLAAGSRQIFRRALSLRNSYQRQNQDNESLISIVSLDAGRMVLGMKRLESGLEWHLRFALDFLSALTLTFVGYWSWRLHLSGECLYVSIRHKLVALFLYATAIPVTALLLLGYQYMLDRNQVMVQERLVQLSGMTENIDDSFQAAVRSLEQLYRKVSRLSVVQRGEIARANALFARMKDAEQLTQAFMVDSSGRLHLMEMSSQGKDLLGKLIPTLARKIFQSRLGQSEEDLKAKVSDVMVESLTDSVAEFMAGKGSQKIFGELIESNDKIIEFMLGKNGNLMYSTFLWGEGQKKPANLLLIVHRVRSFAQKYLGRLVRRNHHQPEAENPVRLAVVSRVDDKKIFPADYTKYPFMKEMSDKVISTETQHNSVEEIGGEPYLVVASPLKKMPDFILVAMYPRRLIDEVISGISLKIGSIAVVSGFFAFFIGLLLARHFLWPINELSSGVSAIEQRDFNHVVPSLGRDEFGDLGTTFNRVISNFEEMHVGKVVQETLFPKCPIRKGEYDLHGASDSMTDLGGDYFDYFVVNDRYVITVIGDVTGHGVPAALLMAMAKSGVAMLSPDESIQVVSAMERLNAMVFETVKRKRLMSFFYAAIDTVANRIETVNAGHCFPFWYQASPRTVSQVENEAFPLGARRKSVFENVPVFMAPGDCLVLYTDGIVEALDDDGKSIGYDRLGGIVAESCRAGTTSAEIHAAILTGVKKMTGPRPAGDDVTLIVIKRFIG